MNQVASAGMTAPVSVAVDPRILRSTLVAATAASDAAAVWSIATVSHVIAHLSLYGVIGNMLLAMQMAALLTFVFLFANLLRGRYQPTRFVSKRRQVWEALIAWNIAMVAFIAIGFLTRLLGDYSRATVVVTYFLGMPVLALTRPMLVGAISAVNKKHRFVSTRVIVVGRQVDVVPFVQRQKQQGSELIVEDVALLRDSTDRASIAEDLAGAVALARRVQPNSVFLVLPWSEQSTIDQCTEAFLNTPVAINLAAEWVLDRFDSPRISHHGQLASLELTRPAMSGLTIFMKRAFDFAGALVLTILTAPVLAIAAIAIKIEDGGPVFFRQRRFGFNQQPFQIIKLRTMSVMDDGDTIRQASRNDTRITSVGSLLRRFSIDELPQLINVLRGEMSLVGPRPHALAHDREYEMKISQYARRHNVKPGITGWAQIHGLRGETQTVEKMSKRVRFDLWYIDNWSAWLDIVILLRTAFSRRTFANAY
ncbi:MAG: exopolysaccharide biosynthesis polyprenyl glycosylphosphotransferase [Aestuariivirga sp.]